MQVLVEAFTVLSYHRGKQRPIRREDVFGGCRTERGRGDVVVPVGVRGGRAPRRLERPLAGVIVAVGRDPAAASLAAPDPSACRRSDGPATDRFAGQAFVVFRRDGS